MPATRSRWSGIHFETSMPGSSLNYVNLLADTIMGNSNSDTKLIILNNPNITLSHIKFDTNTYVGIKAINSTIHFNYSTVSPKFSPYFLDIKGGKIFINNVDFIRMPSDFIYYGLARFSDVDSAFISNNTFTDSTNGNVPEIFSVSDTGKIFFIKDVIKKFGEININSNFTGKVWIDKNQYFHPKNILSHNSSEVYMTNNIIYLDDTDSNPFSLITLDGAYKSKPLLLDFKNNTWFKKGDGDNNVRLQIGNLSNADTVKVINNIFYGLNNFYSQNGGTLIFEYNAYEPEKGNNNNIGTAALAFMDISSENTLNLAQRYNSSGINAGMPNSFTDFLDTLDIAGKSRFINDTIDLGAYEFEPLRITNQPGNTTICEGSNTSFTIVTNFSPQTYQWQTSTDSINWTDAGNNQNSFDITNASAANGDTTITYIRCIVMANGFKNDTSNTAVLTVNPKLNISVSISADDTTVCQGTQVTFTDTPINGGTSPTFRWFVNNAEQNGQTSSTFYYTPTDNDQVYCQLTSSEACVNNSAANSNSVTLTVNPTINITAETEPITTISKGKITITATGGDNNYQYSLDNINFSTSNVFYNLNKNTYTIYVKDNSGCSDSITVFIDSISSPCRANFSYNIDTIQRKVSFINNSIAADIYYWQFGDGKTSNQQQPQHTYTNDGNYQVCLSVYNENQTCISDTCISISIFQNVSNQFVQSKFNYSVDSIDNRVVNLINQSINATNYYWTFGDGKTSTNENPTHIFTNDGIYKVCLNARNALNDNNDIYCREIIAGSPECILISNFSFAIDSLKTGHFINTSNGVFNKIYWNFDDGYTSTQNNPIHTFSSDGTYRVTLTISDSTGKCNSSITKAIEVGTILCRADFDYFVDAANKNIWLRSRSAGNITQYQWQLDQGYTFTGPSGNMVVPSSGLYTITLSIYSDSDNCSDQISKKIQVDSVNCSANFTYLVDSTSQQTFFYSEQSIPGTQKYWLFGDGVISTLANPVHRFAKPGLYTVSLTVYNPITSCFDYIERLVTIEGRGNDCEADFIYFTLNNNPLNIHFRDRSQGNINSYQWNFGDGTLANTANVIHTFNKQGTYNVCLSVTNTFGISNITCKDVRVGTDVNNIPRANFIYNVDPDNLTVNFFNTSWGNYNSLIWYFGDETGSTDVNPIHTYQQAGLYLVNLSILGETSNSYQYKLINVGINDTFAVRFAYVVNEYSKKAGGYPIDFIGAGLGDQARLKWNFGTGNTDTTSTTTTHVYQDTGTYQVCLTYNDPISGQEATYCENVTTQTLCQADTIKPIAQCKTINVTLNEQGAADITPLDIDNGSTDACGLITRALSRTHFTLADLGYNNVTLTVTDSKGNIASCNAIVNFQKSTDFNYIEPISVNIYPNPFADAIYTTIYLAKPDLVEITLTNLSGRQLAILHKDYQSAGDQLYRLNMQNIRKGTYVLLIKTNTGLMKQRIVIKN